MTLPASIRINVRAPFPTQVKGSAFVSVNKANGVWTIAPNYLTLAPIGSFSPTQVLALQDSVTGAFSVIGAAAMVASGLGIYRTIAAAGSVDVLPTDVVLLFQKSPSGASTINLPASATRGGAPVTAKDLTGDANTNNITFVPAPGETIDGFSASAAAANGVALISIDYGKKTLYPLTSGGWFIL